MILAVVFCMGCGATADKRLVTLTDVDAQLGAAHGADLRWLDKAAEHDDGFDRNEVSEPDAMIAWTDFCAEGCVYVDQQYSAVFEEIAQTAFLAWQLREVADRPDRERFERLVHIGERHVSAERLETLQRRLAALKPSTDFAERPAMRKQAERAMHIAAEQLEIARRHTTTARVVANDVLPSYEPIALVRPYWETAESDEAVANAVTE
jgi:hypothetical protein